MCKLIPYIISTFSIKKIYTLNCVIMVVFNCTNAYVRGCTLVMNNRQIPFQVFIF